MARALVIGQSSETKSALLRSGLSSLDITCFFTPLQNGIREAVGIRQPDIIYLEISGDISDSEIRNLLRKIKAGKDLPVIAILSPDTLDRTQTDIDVDDFLVEPYDIPELVFRTKRLLKDDTGTDSRERIRCDGLTIDLATCEVNIDGQLMELTFKEYELLKLLAGSPGRVFTRETLLDKIWGYDYFGGDRTVDVHIRRLRSKIETGDNTFIETVRNIGYRFKSRPALPRK